MKKLQLVLLLALSAVAYADNNLVVTNPNASKLVSPRIEELVEAAYPAYEQADLEKRLMSAASTLQSRTDSVTVRTITGLERLMGFQPSTSRTNEVDTQVAYYRVDPVSGKAYGQHKRYDFTTTTKEAFSLVERGMRGLQAKFIPSLGLPSDEIMKNTFKKIIVQSLESNSTGNTDGTPAEVRRGFTLAYRGFAGFPIEGSFVRISSFDANRVENFSLSWPKFILHPELSRIVLATKDVIKKAIVEKIRATSTLDQPLSLNMGVVFRQAKASDGRLVHFPAMKVVVTPNPKEMDGVQSEAGLEFFANMLLTAPKIMADDAADRE